MAKAQTRNATLDAKSFQTGHSLGAEGTAGSCELRRLPTKMRRNRQGVSAAKNQYTVDSVTMLNVALRAGNTAIAAMYRVRIPWECT